MAKMKWPKEAKYVYVDVYGKKVWLFDDLEPFNRALDYLDVESLKPIGKCGVTMNLELKQTGEQIILVGIFDKSYETLAHEILHATYAIAKRVGLDLEDEEALCYLHGFMFDKARKLLWPE